MKVVDQMGLLVELPNPPRRIVSLVPSQTELLFDLGVGARVVGATRYCVHPVEAVAPIAKVGGTKKFRFDVIDALQPDLIIGNKEENYAAGIERLQRDYPVWMSDIFTVADAVAMIRSVGRLVDASDAAERLVGHIENGRGELAQLTRGRPPVDAAYFIWRKPWMVAGSDTFVDHLLELAGFRNVFQGLARYPEVDDAVIRACGANVVMLSSEPFPFAEPHLREVRDLLPDADVRLVDGEYFSWYGSRLAPAFDYLRQLVAEIHQK